MGVIDAVAETPTACLNFHIPPQSGSNAVLDSMGRGHTHEKYLQIVDRIRENVQMQPSVQTTHNYIVYFDGDIDELRGKLVNVKIDACHTYSLTD